MKCLVVFLLLCSAFSFADTIKLTQDCELKSSKTKETIQTLKKGTPVEIIRSNFAWSLVSVKGKHSIATGWVTNLAVPDSALKIKKPSSARRLPIESANKIFPKLTSKWDGFRNIPWMTDLRTVRGMQYVETGEAGLLIYERRNENMSIAGVEAYLIRYHTYKHKLILVRIVFLNSVGWETILGAVVHNYGKDYVQSDVNIWSWQGLTTADKKEVNVNMGYDSLTFLGTEIERIVIDIAYMPGGELRNKARQKLIKRSEQDF